MSDLAHQPLSQVSMTFRTLEAICNTAMVPKQYRGNPHEALGAVLLGREIGLGEMTSLQHIDVIDGSPSLSAEIMTALIRRRGHSMYATDWTADACTIQGTRGDTGDTMTVTFDMTDAKRAGLDGKRNWQQHPKAMLWARAVSQLARTLFPDCILAMHAYTPDDVGDHHYIPEPDPQDEVISPAPVTNEQLDQWQDEALEEAQRKADREPLVMDAVEIQQRAHEDEPGLEEAKANVKAMLQAIEVDPETYADLE